MIAMTVDDELPLLRTLNEAVSASPDITELAAFSTCREALAWAGQHAVDVAFLDIRMRGMGGLALAEKIMDLQPQCRIVFCTGYDHYALDAFRLHVSGYLMKPITPEAVQAELDHIKGELERGKKLTIQCFGNFEAFAGGEPLHFRRKKSKELLAVLVDRKGAVATTKQICAILWEEGGDEYKLINYFYQLLAELRHTLRKVGAEELLIQKSGGYALDTTRLDCDYYSFLKKGRPEFHGEYMTQYSWGEETAALLTAVLTDQKV